MHVVVAAVTSGKIPERCVAGSAGGTSYRTRAVILSLSAVLLLGGCSYASEALWPSLTGSDPRGAQQGGEQRTQRQEVPPSAAERNPQPTLSPAPAQTAQAAPPGANQAPLQPSQMTEVGRRAMSMREEVQKLAQSVGTRTTAMNQIRGETVQTAQRYQGLIGGINARLQVGTTPGNPILQSQWNQASAELDRFGADIGRMSTLSNQVAADAAMAAFLLESTRAAYSLSGAVEEDHRALATLEDEVNKTVVSIDRLLNELSEDISRQSAYVSRERSNMTALSTAIKNGELYGTGLANRAFLTTAPVDGSSPRLGAAPGAAPPAGSPAATAAGGRPLVVIRFDRPNPAYEQALYTAVSRAIERRPDVTFDLVAVSPGRGSQAQVALAASTAKRQAESVMRSLTDMGLPANRVSMSASTSNSAQTNEVHLYVR
jgi:hypothetical protein